MLAEKTPHRHEFEAQRSCLWAFLTSYIRHTNITHEFTRTRDAEVRDALLPSNNRKWGCFRFSPFYHGSNIQAVRPPPESEIERLAN